MGYGREGLHITSQHGRVARFVCPAGRTLYYIFGLGKLDGLFYLGGGVGEKTFSEVSFIVI